MTWSQPMPATRRWPSSPMSRRRASGASNRRSMPAGDGVGLGLGHETALPVRDELQRSAGVAGREDGLAGEEGLDGHVAVVLVVRGVEGGPAPRVQGQQVLGRRRSPGTPRGPRARAAGSASRGRPSWVPRPRCAGARGRPRGPWPRSPGPAVSGGRAGPRRTGSRRTRRCGTGPAAAGAGRAAFAAQTVVAGQAVGHVARDREDERHSPRAVSSMVWMARRTGSSSARKELYSVPKRS